MILERNILVYFIFRNYDSRIAIGTIGVDHRDARQSVGASTYIDTLHISFVCTFE